MSNPIEKKTTPELILATKIGKEKEGTKDWSLGDTGKDRAGDDEAPSTRTVCSRPDRKDRIHKWRESLMPRDESLERSFSWSTLSNAFEKSKRTASICCFLFRQSVKSLTVVMSWVSQLLFCLNPCWNSLRRECCSKWSIMLLWMMCSRIFDVTEVREMGL